MKLWPSRSSTVVEASRTVSAGTEMPPAIDTECAGSSWLTFGLITMLIWPSLSTVGVKARPTPYFLYSIVTWPSAAGHRDRIFAAGEEARGIARQRHEIGLRQVADEALLFERIELDIDRIEPPIRRPTRKPNGDAPDSTPAATTGEMVARGRCWPADSHARMLERTARRSDRQLRRWNLVADIGQEAVAEHVPLHAKFAAGLARRFDEAHLQHDLLRLRHLDGVDDVRRKLARDAHRLVERDGVRRPCRSA